VDLYLSQLSHINNLKNTDKFNLASLKKQILASENGIIVITTKQKGSSPLTVGKILPKSRKYIKLLL